MGLLILQRSFSSFLAFGFSQKLLLCLVVVWLFGKPPQLGGINFVKKLGAVSVLYAELMAIILALELAARHAWMNIWVESDSTAALGAFDDPNLVNACEDKLANHGHQVADSVWWDSLPSFLRDQFLHDKM
ncbi:hypothetical protein A2U01_0037626, partial [Trifolium medium]|nr:hypothetical protein [Trifolium medium]